MQRSLDLSKLGKKDKLSLIEILELEARKCNENLMQFYSPYPKQREFHRLGSEYPERCFMAGNQTGKSLPSSMEVSYHSTGLYPSDWEGETFDKPTVGWVCGVTSQVIRDSMQRLLVGRIEIPDTIGTGAIPKDKIINLQRAMGVPNYLDHIAVKHVTGGTSLIFFKSYADGRQKFQAETIDWIAFDEEPPEDIYSEGLTRTNNGQRGQFSWLTYTPLMGMSNITHGFLEDPSDYQIVINMTIEEAEHYTSEERKQIIASYPPHEREARAMGIPVLGSGRVYPISEQIFEEETLKEIPAWWPQINGLDFGWDHPQACVGLAWDRDRDIIHVINTFRAKETTPVLAAFNIKKWGEWIPTAWPHDGYQHDKGSGLELAAQYGEAGLEMLAAHATHEAGGFGVEAGVSEIFERMQTGRLKVDKYLVDWWEEFRLYHRIKGAIVKERDDLMSATRYAMMMLRYAETAPVDYEEEDDFESRDNSALGWS